MECCGYYSSPRSDVFPAGLRVLVVDDDPTWLKILEKMLKKCSYEVTTCGLAREALNLLRERKDGFDIVISDVNMPDMDGFKLLEHVGLEMDLPVIMMSVDGETSRVMKGVQHGACDYLLKPIRMKELRNIWQHVFRKRIHEVRDIENHDGLEDMRNGLGHMEDIYFSCGTDLTSVKKRKEFENKHDDEECNNDHLSVKKTRVIWTIDLHQKFVKAVNLIGLDKVGPKKILDLMAIPWLTRENVASHLQKYRLYLSRLQKEKELNASVSRMKHRGFSSKEDNENQCLKNLTTKQQKESTSGNSSISRNSSTMPNIDFRILEGDMKCTVSKTIGEPKQSPKGQNLDPLKNSISRMKFKNPFGQFDSEVNLVNTIGMQNPWNAEIPQLRLEQESNQHFLPNNGFNLVTLPAFQQKNIKLECLQPVPFPKSKPSSIETHISAEEVKPASVNGRSKGIGQFSPERSRNDLFSILPDTEVTTETTSKSNPSTLWNIDSQRQYQIPVSGLKSEQQRINLANVTAFASWGENPRVCSFDRDSRPLDLGLENVESLSSSSDPELIAEAPSCLYDSLRFDCEYPSDSVEFSLVDNGLFII